MTNQTMTNHELSSRSTLLQAENLTKTFGGLTAVNNVSFAVKPKEIFGLIGPNGAGKTTLFNLITGMIPPTSGKMYYDSEEISHLKPYQIAKKGISRTFQNIRLFKELSALENVMIARHIHSSVGNPFTSMVAGIFNLPQSRAMEKMTRQQAEDLLNLVGLSDRCQEQAGNFAYGDQRRLEIARALALEPEVLLLDEPAAGMNPTEKHQLSDFIRELHKKLNLTIVLIEHHVPLVMGLCDRIAVLDFGELIALGTPDVVKNDPAVIAAYLGDEV